MSSTTTRLNQFEHCSVFFFDTNISSLTLSEGSTGVNHTNFSTRRAKQQSSVWAHYEAIYGSRRSTKPPKIREDDADWTVTGKEVRIDGKQIKKAQKSTNIVKRNKFKPSRFQLNLMRLEFILWLSRWVHSPSCFVTFFLPRALFAPSDVMLI